MELTDKCNARCVQCERNFIDKNGVLNERPQLLKKEISIEQFKKIFENYKWQTYNLTFCGNFGDPLFAKDIFDITQYSYEKVLSQGSGIQINTNGGYKSKEWWAEYGKLLKNRKHTVVFAIDGLEDTNHLYRVNTRFDRIIENAQAFIDAGGDARWSFIRFGHNQHQEEEARQMAKKMGFKQFETSNTQRFHKKESIKYKWLDKEYEITRYNPSILKSLDPIQKKAIQTNKMLQKNSKNYLKDKEKWRQETAMEITCYTEQKNDLYIDAKGYVYPCCWIGTYEYEKMANIEDPWNPQIDGRVLNSCFDKDFREILKEDWWEYQLPQSWDNDPCHICARHCGKNVIKTIRNVEST
tara:strand:+ start:345 stop:1406 length:1062 start_codon:yes stop_codon:yes gene_type:complete